MAISASRPLGYGKNIICEAQRIKTTSLTKIKYVRETVLILENAKSSKLIPIQIKAKKIQITCLRNGAHFIFLLRK